MEGWIMFYRKSLDHWLYNENRPHTKREAWEDILLLVNHAPKKVPIGNELFDCNRGQSVRSLDNWAKHFKWTKSRVERFFKLLKKDGMIETENLYKTIRVTICNYDIYQRERNAIETQPNKNRNGSELQISPNNNVKNENKKELRIEHELIINKTKEEIDGDKYFMEI